MALADSPSRIVRPKSSFVQVTDISSSCINPKPLNSQSLGSIDDYITEGKLKEIAKCNDLSNVTTLELKADVEKITFGNFGAFLPNLRHLKFSNSKINAVRDIGTGFDRVEVFWMSRCCLQSLDGLSSMVNLVELYLSFNEISDLSPCAMLEFLEVLDLEGNSVRDKDNLNYLRTCRQLTNLTLEGNPIISECGSIKKYRTLVRNVLPQVKLLDDFPVKQCPTQKHSGYDITHFDNEWNHINNLLKEVGLLSIAKNQGRRTSIAASNGAELNRIQPHIQGKPCSSLRPSSSRPKSHKINRFSMPSSNLAEDSASVIQISRPPSSLATESETIPGDPEEDGSDLTTGKIVCGGIGSALRNRRSSAKQDELDLLPHGTQPKEINLADEHQEEDDEIEVGTDVPSSKAVEHDSVVRTRHKRNDPLLKEEEQLRIECDQVLKELDEWRKHFGHRIFKPRERPHRNSKSKPKCIEQEAVLISTESDSTLDDASDKTEPTESVVFTKFTQNDHVSSNQSVPDTDNRSMNSASSGYESRHASSHPEKLTNEGSIESGIGSGQETWDELGKTQSTVLQESDSSQIKAKSTSVRDGLLNGQVIHEKVEVKDTSASGQHLPGQTSHLNPKTKTLSNRYQSRSPFPPIIHSTHYNNNRQALSSSTFSLLGGKTQKKQPPLDFQLKPALSQSNLIKTDPLYSNSQSAIPMSRNGGIHTTPTSASATSNIPNRLAAKLAKPSRNLLPSKPTLKPR